MPFPFSLICISEGHLQTRALEPPGSWGKSTLRTGCRPAERESGDSRIYSFPLELLVVWDHLPPHVTAQLCEHAGWKAPQRSACTSTHPPVHGAGRCALPASVHTHLSCTHTSAAPWEATGGPRTSALLPQQRPSGVHLTPSKRRHLLLPPG